MSTVDGTVVEIDPSVQPRVQLDHEAVTHYAALMGQGVEFPPVVAFKVGDRLVLASGFHRWAASEKSGVPIKVNTLQGTLREARVYAISQNLTHGVRYTNADKRRIVNMYLDDPDLTLLSDRKISSILGVSNTFVSIIRAERLEAEKKADPEPQPDEWDDDEPEKKAEGGETPPDKPAPVVDKEMQEVPEHLRAVFTDGAKFFREAVDNLRQTRDVLVEAAEKGQFGKYLRPQDVKVELSNVIEALRFASPHAVCPACKGRGCDPCRQQGWVPSQVYKAIVEKR